MGAAGGVWKTVNAGQTWANVSDGFLTTGSIGAIAVSDKTIGAFIRGNGYGSTVKGKSGASPAQPARISRPSSSIGTRTTSGVKSGFPCCGGLRPK